MINIKGKVGRAASALILAFMPVLGLTNVANASCVYPGQEAAIAAAQQAETSSPVVTVIEACGGDDTSYQIPLSVDVTFDGRVFEDVYVTTNSVITFGRPDNTYWDYPQTPSISLYSMDWVVYPQARQDEHLIISSSEGGFQVNISARPIWQQQATEPTNIIITAAILSDGTVAMAYSLDGPTYDGSTRTGVRLNDGTVVDFETYGIDQVTESPELSPEPTTESPFVPEPTESPTVSPEPEPTQSPEPTPDPSESPTVSPEPQEPVATPPFIPAGATVYGEGQVAEIVAPQGQRISSILGYYGDPNDSRNGLDVSPVLAQFAGSQSATIQANNEMFTDPAAGIVKIMILLVTFEDIPYVGPTPEEIAAEQAAAEAARLETERIEAERIEAERIAELLRLERIAAEQAAEAARQEAARQEAARVEAERIAAEQAAQAAAIEAARLEAERVAAEAAAAEAARIAAEQAAAAEAARLEAERLEAARIEAERLAALEQAERERQERLAAEAEAARIEAERIAAEQAAEAARLEAERIAAEQAAEAARLEAERLEAERLAAEAAAAAEAARLEAERLEAERLAAEEAARIEAERVEAERLAAEKAEEEARLEAERKAAEVEAKEKARLEAEARAEAERLERERLEAEENKPTPTPEPTKEPTPTEQPVVVEIKEPITAENITAVVEELATIAPQQLTEEQQTLITEAALETFSTAEQGSAEYEAALDALLVVAQADDIVVDEELAAIPLLGNAAVAAVEVFNALGNAGADMSPQVREQSEKVVVASVIVANIAITATSAATSAAAVAARRP